MSKSNNKPYIVDWISAIATAAAAIIALGLGITATCQNKRAIEQSQEMIARTDSSLKQGRMMLMRTDSSLQQGRLMLERTDSSLAISRSALLQGDRSLAIAKDALSTQILTEFRPYIKPSFKPPDFSGDSCIISFQLRNVGRSPARRVHVPEESSVRPNPDHLVWPVSWIVDSPYQTLYPDDEKAFRFRVLHHDATCLDPFFFFYMYEYCFPKPGNAYIDSTITYFHMAKLQTRDGRLEEVVSDEIFVVEKFDTCFLNFVKPHYWVDVRR